MERSSGQIRRRNSPHCVQVDNADEVIDRLKKEFDAVVEQEGNYSDGSGRYIYLSLQKELKCRLEILESYR